MSNDYFKAQGWFKNYALNSQDSRGVFQQLVKEDEEAFRLASAETDRIKDMINEKFGPGTMKPASELPPIQNPFEDFEKRNPAAEGGRMRFSEGLDAKKKSEKALDLQKINNPSQEALDEIATIVDKYTKTSDVAGKEIKHLSKDGPIDKIFKEVKTKGYKRPSVAKEIFKQVLESKGITTYDNYRTNKIVFTLQDVLRKNNGDILSIKPSAVAEILPEFAIEGKKGGKGLPAFRTFLNYLEGSERLIDRSGLEKPGQIAGKPVSQIIDEMKQNFLEIKGGRARGNFTVFEETKLLEKIGLENPNATANELKKLYEKAGGNSFRERVNTLYLAKTGQITNKTDGGKSIIDAVKSGEITNKRPDSLRNSFKTYVKDYNFARFTRFAGEETDPKMIRYYNDIASKFFTTGAQTKYGTKGLVAEHGLPISAYDRGVADISTRAKIDGYVTTEVNNWKAKNFDYPVFRPGGLADKYKNASAADKPKIQQQIENRLKIAKIRTPDLVKNITFDFKDGIFTASSSTPEISEEIIPTLKKTGQNTINTFQKTEGLTTADKAPTPDKTKTRDMFTEASERFADQKGFITPELLGADKIAAGIEKAKLYGPTYARQIAKGALPVEAVAGAAFMPFDLGEGRTVKESLINAITLGAGVPIMDAGDRADYVDKFGLKDDLFSAQMKQSGINRLRKGITSLTEREELALEKANEFDTEILQPRLEKLLKERKSLTEDMGQDYYNTGAKDGGIMRLGFADGPDDPSKRKFIKIMGGLASIPILGRFLKPVVPVVEEVVRRGADGVPDFIMDLIAKVKLKAEATGLKYFTGNRSDEFADVYQADDFVVTEQGNKITVRKRKQEGDMLEKDMEMEIETDPETGGVTYNEATARPDAEGKLKDVEEFIDDFDLEEMKKYTYDE